MQTAYQSLMQFSQLKNSIIALNVKFKCYSTVVNRFSVLIQWNKFFSIKIILSL